MPKLSIEAVIALALVGLGWWLHSLYTDSKELAQLQAIEQSQEAWEKRESSIAKAVEDKLAELKANDKVIERWRTQFIDRPVYLSDCIDADGVLFIQALARGNAAELATALPKAIDGTGGKDGSRPNPTATPVAKPVR